MDAATTIPFDSFWTWLMAHPNCILRAGTPEAIIYDDDDLHWHFAAEEPQTLLVQVLRGKRLVGEILIDPETVSYIEALPREREDEYVFELISEHEKGRFPAFFFVLIHGWEQEEAATSARVH